MPVHSLTIFAMVGWCSLLLAVPGARAEEKILFDFEDEGSVKAWRQIDVHALREAEAKANPETKAAPPPILPKEPAVKIEWTTENVTRGQHAMKLTFAGGRFPTVSTKAPLEDWRPYKSFHADVTASRTCMVVFRAMSETSKYGTSYNDGVSRWEFAARLNSGKNSVVAPSPPNANVRWNQVKTFEIYMYQPREGETVTIDNVRLSSQPVKDTSPFNEALAVPPGKYKVLGTDLEVKDVNELADKLKDGWVRPMDKAVDQVEADFHAEFEVIRKKNPRAVLTILRDGQKGYDPAHLDREFVGWKDAGTPSHLPMALTLSNFANSGKSAQIETCFRNRPGFLQVDLSSIPQGAEILAAKLLVVRGRDMGNNWSTKPTMFVAEPCNRPWQEYEVNVFEYARDKFWNEYAGLSWGDDADCTAVFLAHGPSAGKTLVLDFTYAVRYWTGGKHSNQGFILYGAPKYVDYFHVFTRECQEVKNRPALLVIYEPKR